MSPPAPLLEVHGISKAFRGLRAVHEASFDVPERGLVALIGPNGAGKTTCFNLIAGALQPDRGAIVFGGTRIDGWRASRICAAGIGRTFQIVKPFPGLSVLDNVIVGALLRANGTQEARRHARDVVDRLGLGRKADVPASTLTLPERKRLEVARALATRPRLLLLDEVMAGLRPTECDQMVQVLRELNARQGVAILLIEHVMRAVMALAQHVVVLNFGQVLARGTPAEVVRHPAVLGCYLGEEAEV
ncbi:MAG TPA: ABC transporter ATP-binding protein [Burkholderiaceae bacterium]|nr:ABC transporter ATP-binding protein [Burkholderiaceae bacterium]